MPGSARSASRESIETYIEHLESASEWAWSAALWAMNPDEIYDLVDRIDGVISASKQLLTALYPPPPPDPAVTARLERVRQARTELQALQAEQLAVRAERQRLKEVNE